MGRPVVPLAITAMLALASCGSPQRDALPVATSSMPPVLGPAATAPPTHAPAAPTAPTGSHHGDVSVPGLLNGNLGFHDQVSDGRTVVGSAEIDGSGGWVVVQEERAGKPGPVLGSIYRPNEAHDDVVTVHLSRRVGSGSLWVSLHVDAGTPRRLEIPGPDLPVQFAGADLTERLVLSVR